jgi:hypothetical protein
MVDLFTASNLVAVYSILIGFMMIGVWVFSFVKNQVPELREKPKALAFHLMAEFSTTILLIILGFGLFFSSEWARMLSPLSLGMLLDTVIMNAGYFAHQDNLPMVTMFLVIIFLTIMAIITLFMIG